ncbi:MAG TPA: hypothetical protein VGT40_08715 [Methylomirabilota bacterium]|jgi:hypothetical protein|nr:hypothetical protein [Methylomirabilota bacterium]
MRRYSALIAAVGVLVWFGLPDPVRAGGPAGAGSAQTYTLDFESSIMLAPTPPAGWPTATSPWPPNGTNPSANGMGATGWMQITQVNGQSDVQVFVRGARPSTLYTIWTVFKPLLWCADPSTGCPDAFAPPGSTKPGFGSFPPGFLPFYPEASPVAPTASLASAFTSGMGLDPGITFYTNKNGDGQIHVKLDYNLLGTTYDEGPPVANATTVSQCAVPGPPMKYTSATCPPMTITINGNPVTTVPKFTVTSSWLRKYISQVDDPAIECANFDPNDPTSIFWQCIDPATTDPRTGTGLPRVWRFPFDHFRLAAHPDELTHGFIGGSAFEHTIDMVGRRCRIQPALPGEPGC